MAKNSKTERVLKLARQMGVVRPRDLAQHGIPPVYLQRLCKRELLTQSARGIYRLAQAPLTAQHTLASVCKRIPDGVVCLLSALQFHQITTPNPEIWGL